MNHRLFFALWPDDAVRARIDAAAALVERSHASGGRRLRRDRLHVTVQFIGDFAPLPGELVGAACEAASRVESEPFVLTLDHAGSFRGSRVWWLGCTQCPPELQTLWNALGQALREAEVPMKSHPQFTPHVTILRDVRRALAPTPVEPIAWPVSGFVLIDSQDAAGYVSLGRWPLRG